MVKHSMIVNRTQVRYAILEIYGIYRSDIVGKELAKTL